MHKKEQKEINFPGVGLELATLECPVKSSAAELQPILETRESKN